MLLLTVVYDKFKEDIVEKVSEMKQYFNERNITVGFSESIDNNTHFLKIFCDENAYDSKLTKIFNFYMADILYDLVIDEFYKKEIHNFITNTYFFLKYDEIKEIKNLSLKALKNKGPITNENMVFYRNRKNSIIQKITDCIEENKEININGFIRFRMKEFINDLESIIDKVVENYMVEKEYSEFIKLLKYFVDLQESKIEKINIIIEGNENYILQDGFGNDIMDILFSDLSDDKFSGAISIDDMLISALITNAPKNIIIHGKENCSNKEILDTITSVFGDRVKFCDKCNMCKNIKSKIKS
ncbi:putative sporulation protein YtxC [Clostridium sp. USBA 49]|jgi:putative sporulation protein YtxC|uniref:putative sporulation protein YtxC n=1 Tax=Clostridium TaxID=1485 RepID=UPI00099AC0E6|nr:MULTISPECIES: putative sporulation protein YtxC [Clostridium]SKA83669.1 putative sporulation protein YtxC [Clostridium sp. USBA 49]